MSERETDFELEIAHVLFIDVVGYSKLLVDDQREVIAELNRLVRATEAFRAAEQAGKLSRVPTGDGMALAFFTTPEAPAQCAVELAKWLRGNPLCRVRMGLHSGPISGVTDVNDQSNIAGAGINIAQRVMDCGDAGHILLSRHIAEDLENYRVWQPYLHELGECEVKHGTRLGLVNLYSNEVGNREMPGKLKETAAHTIAKTAPNRRRVAIVFSLFLLLAALGVFILLRPVAPPGSEFDRPPFRSVRQLVQDAPAHLPRSAGRCCTLLEWPPSLCVRSIHGFVRRCWYAAHCFVDHP